MFSAFRKLFPSKHEKDVRALLPVVEEMNEIFEKLKDLSDEDLRGKTVEFRGRIREALNETEERLAVIRGELKKDTEGAEREKRLEEQDELEKERDEITADTLDEILPEAYAVVKDACRRLVGTSFDLLGNRVDLGYGPVRRSAVGGMVLHQGKIAEMATGEGKTLVATMPVYLNALPGRGVHLVTVNDYLAKRDSVWMGTGVRISRPDRGVYPESHGFLSAPEGICLRYHLRHQQRVRVRLSARQHGGGQEDLVQREYYYAIVDEVDSVLIDEARTPLIISGPVKSEDHKFDEMKPHVERLVKAQRTFISKIVAEAEKLLAEGKEEEAGVLLLRASRGLPKHPRLMKVFTEPANKKLVQRTENEYLRDQSRRMHEIDDELYYAIDEKNHQINLTEKGRKLSCADRSGTRTSSSFRISGQSSACPGARTRR